ncbi:neutral ceramidase [Chelonus insularis]|uniref:neutral ceramidase n=1 Tax=Chelonus insularis TaxID=460826 RepID=UPI00158B0B1E|nr:neutral ceramidase [Chelonus insularis]XP_034949884.1 neutral ceramidase [Chelonus insularis]XP_034949885.1 neutral ceramidase [Chelonus insularis]XP_034949886.1 neutral ceramidase [Chelonus insularis]XP_034949888.1 neutral ceramidase [Chelonus insularis]
MDSYCYTIGLRALFFLLFFISITSQMTLASYNIGVGRADVTGPVAEIVFMGYAKIDQKGEGLHLRTYARSFIIDDGNERFVFVSVESAMIGHDVRAAVIRRLRDKFGNLYTEENVMISATHTHSSPGGYNLYMLFDLTTFGFIKQSFTALINGITTSIERAHDSIVPGKLFIDHGEVLDANINRSPMAYLNNPQSERNKYKYDVDKNMTQLQFIAADGRPLGIINWFAVHPTSMNNTNKLVSSDNVGYAAVLFEKMMNKDALVGQGEFVAAFASSNLGDVSPNTRGPKCEFSGNECSAQYTCPGKNEMCFASGPGKDMFESTRIIAHKLFNESTNIWNKKNAVELKGPVRIVHRFVKMPGQKAEFFNQSTNNNEEVETCLPAMGYSFAAGTTDGPGSFAFEQGTKTSNPMWNAVRNFVAAPTDEDIKCHGAKPILLATGRMRLPYLWQPKIVSTHLAMVGDLVIAGVPGEFTTMSGRRTREMIASVVEENTKIQPVVVIAGLCNTYSDYITTPEEYEIQRYEGASTIYGPHTLTVYLKQYRELAAAATQGIKLEPGPSPPDLTLERLISLQTSVIYDTPKWGKDFGDCIHQSEKIVWPGDTVSVTFVAGHPRNNLMTGRSFLSVEKLENDTWIEIATDADWETRFHWVRTSVILGTSEVEIKWEIPLNAEPGKYRIGHFGSYRYIFGGIYPYQGHSNIFEVKTQESVKSHNPHVDSAQIWM